MYGDISALLDATHMEMMSILNNYRNANGRVIHDNMSDIDYTESNAVALVYIDCYKDE